MLIGNREMGGVYDLRVRAHRERRGQATIEAHMMFSDAFGNEFLGAVYGTKLMGDTIQGADWSTKETIDWPHVWTIYIKNRAFQ